MNHKKLIVIFFFSILFGVFNTANSQIFHCRTLFTPAEYSYAQNRTQIILSQLPTDSVISLPQINKTLSIAIHIVKDSIGDVNVDLNDIYLEIDNTNELFKPISLDFRVCSVDSIDNFQYDHLFPNSFTTTYEEEQIVNLFNVDSIINIYVVESPYGLSNKNYIIVSKQFLKAIPHLMGDVFGLLHTNGNGDHAELVDRSNCLTTGDFVCETDADPQLATSPIIPYSEVNCELRSSNISLYPIKDINDQWYKIPSYNYMSSYSDCWCKLTPFQYRIIVYEYYLNHNYLR